MTKPRRHFPPQVHGNTVIDPTARIDVPHMAHIDAPPPTRIKEGVHIGAFTVVHRSTLIAKDVRIGSHCTIGPGAVVKEAAEIADGCYIGAEAMIGGEARLGDGCIIGPDCGVGTRARLGIGVNVLDQPRLPRRSSLWSACPASRASGRPSCQAGRRSAWPWPVPSP